MAPRKSANLLQAAQTVSAVMTMAISLLMGNQAHATDPITASGLNTQVSDPIRVGQQTQYDITGGTRAGANVFHSFGDFHVPQKNIANFLNDTGSPTANILGRVTGGQASTIFGTIQTTGFGDAHLFLMNPAGIVFGPTASLNVGGSVTFTTADYLRLNSIDGTAGIFHANATVPHVLSSAPVAAFGFLGSTPAAITVQGATLTTPPGQSMSFVGGNIAITSSTLAADRSHPAQSQSPAGQINLASVASPGEILSSTWTTAPNIQGQSFDALGTITITDRSVIDASAAGGGTVRIRSGHFVLDNSNIVAHVTGPGTVSDGVESVGSGITIAASQDVTIQNGAAVEVNVASGATHGTTYGGVQVQADRIIFRGLPGSALNFDDLPFTGITTNTEGTANAGPIVLGATRNIELNNVVQVTSFSGFSPRGEGPSTTMAQGHAGDIELTSLHGDILMTNGGRATLISSQVGNSTGNTGRVTATAAEGTILLEGAGLVTRSAGGAGQIGPVAITAKNLYMKAGILANENRGPSKPGGIAVTLSGNLTMMAGSALPTDILPESFIVTSAFSPTATAPAGDITITANHIAATQQSLISSETFSSGSGGQLTIVANSLQVAGGSQIKSGSAFAPEYLRESQATIPTGVGGDILIHARGPTGSLVIDGNGSGIFSNAEGTGAGGSITLSAKTLTVQNGGTLSTETSGTSPRAIGGSITVKASERVTLTNGGSITASSAGAGDAGTVSINAGHALDLYNSSITTQALTASGGDMDIRAINRVRLVNSEISTSVKSASGSGGNIFIDPQLVILQGSTVSAQAIGGAGGNIRFVTPLFLADTASLVSASSESGPSGTVSIQSPTSNLSETVGQLTSQPSQVQTLVHNRCAALAHREQSSFILAGRESHPTTPGGWLSSPNGITLGTAWMPEVRGTVHGKVASPTPASEILSLRRLTPPGFLLREFAGNTTGCQS